MPRVNIKPAASGSYPHQYDVCSALTLDFGELLPTRVFSCVPTDGFKQFYGEGSLRLAPTAFPTYGKAWLKNAAFFVPEHQLIECADAFHMNQSTYKGKAVVKPFFYSTAITDILRQSGYSSVVTSLYDPIDWTQLPARNTYDFCAPVQVSGGGYGFAYYRLTTKGRRFYKLFKSLGYDFPSFSYESNYNATVLSGTNKVDALKLLAFVKVYVDMFLSGVQYNNSLIVSVLHNIHDGEAYNGTLGIYDVTTGNINSYLLENLLLSILLPHEQNLYTMAWNSPNSPSGVAPSSDLISQNPNGLVSPFNPPVLSSSTGSNIEPSLDATSDYTGLTVRESRTGNHYVLDYLSQYGLNLLNSFYKFVRRFGLAGSKSVQKVFAAFGIKSDDFNSHYVHKLFEGAERIALHPVFSNADTRNSGSGMSLGDYAGMGIGGLKYDFNYNATDYGYIVCVAWVQVLPMLLHGFDPDNLRLNPQDYFTPEYDGKALRAIPFMEVSGNLTGRTVSGTSPRDSSVYGFCGLYDDYRFQRDVIAGDFVVSDVARSWLFCRDFNVLRETYYNTTGFHPQDNLVQYYDMDKNEDMTDPFQMDKNNGDRFYLFIDWTIKANRPILPLADSLDLNGSGATEITVNGHMLS